MTLIIAKIDRENKETIMIGDSLLSEQTAFFRGKNPKVLRKKVATKKGKIYMLIGYSGNSTTVPQSIEFKKFPEINTSNYRKYMINDFVPFLKKTFRNEGLLCSKDKRSKIEEFPGTFLVAIKDHIFRVWYDFSVGCYDQDYAAIGCAWQFAEGMLLFNNTHDIYVDNKKLLYNIMELCSQKSHPIKEPFRHEVIKF